MKYEYRDMTYKQLEAARAAISDEITARLRLHPQPVKSETWGETGLSVSMHVSVNGRYTLQEINCGIKGPVKSISRVKGAMLAGLSGYEFLDKALDMMGGGQS